MPKVVDLPPPPVDLDGPGGNGGGSDWVVLVTARDDIDAHLLLGRLAEGGITARSLRDPSTPVWLYAGAGQWMPVRVLVRRFQLEEARMLLAELSFEGPAEDRPPDERVGRRRSTSIVWWVTAVLAVAALLFTIFMQVFRHTIGCQLAFFCDRPSPAEGRP